MNKIISAVSLGKESQICNVRQQISTLTVFTGQFPVSLVSHGKIPYFILVGATNLGFDLICIDVNCC